MSMIKCERLDFIIDTIKNAYRLHGMLDRSSLIDKSKYDLVTSTDYNIEKHIISKIQERYPNDKILSEETNSNTLIENHTWTIDPIDGTYNMANNIKLYGVQCAMYIDGVLNLSAIYIPHFEEMYYAKSGQGAYLNERLIEIKKNDLEHSIVSFGDFPHSRPADAEIELKMMKNLYSKIAKIRMFGAACMDFACVASGKTTGTIIFTKNKWDIAPGLLLCKEAGATINGFEGGYTEESAVVIATATDELYQVIIASAM